MKHKQQDTAVVPTQNDTPIVPYNLAFYNNYWNKYTSLNEDIIILKLYSLYYFIYSLISFAK